MVVVVRLLLRMMMLLREEVMKRCLLVGRPTHRSHHLRVWVAPSKRWRPGVGLTVAGTVAMGIVVVGGRTRRRVHRLLAVQRQALEKDRIERLVVGIRP